MCMWFGFNPAVNFCHFSILLTLSFFAGATSTSPKFDLYFKVGRSLCAKGTKRLPKARAGGEHKRGCAFGAGM